MAITLCSVRNSQGAELLREAIARESEGKRLKDMTVHWGTTGDGLNGMSKVDGYRQLDLLWESDGHGSGRFKVPYCTDRIDTARVRLGRGLSMWGRLRNHTKGKDIVQNPRSPLWARREFWVEVVPDVEAEWRIHVLRKSIIGRGLKHYAGSRRTPSIIRNRRLGWRMRHNVDPSDAIRDAARAAIAAIGYDFGAVDMLLTRSGSIYVLEVNKQPGLDNYTAGQYAKAFVRRASKTPGRAR